jgi:hypothetical protein
MVEREFLDALNSTIEIKLIVIGHSGRSTSRPVWFVLEGGTLYLLPVVGSETKWYQDVLTNPQITLEVKGKRMSANATPLRDHAQVARVVDLFRSKHGGDVRRLYSKFDAAVAVPV